MDVPMLAWIGLVTVILTMISVDVLGHLRTPHTPSLREAAWWSAAYVGIGLLFGLAVWAGWGAERSADYYSGFILEKSLSVDNLFVFVIIIAAFRVPRHYQQAVLLSGILVAIVLRGVFIAFGVAIIERWSAVFYLFGAFLIYTAIAQAREGKLQPETGEEYQESGVIRLVRRVVPVSADYEGGKLTTRQDGRWMITPLLLVVVALGSIDVIFALDSIPAIFAITQEPFLVFAANAFSLLGLRQLYFLIDGLLDRLTYLHYGLAAILAYIGAKQIIHALHENSLGFLNNGEPWTVIPEPGRFLSLAVIVVVLAVTVLASLGSRPARASRSAGAAVGGAARGELELTEGRGPSTER